MLVEVHNKLGELQRFEATRILLRDAIDGPILVAVEVGPRHYFITDRGDGDEAMNRALRSLGVNEIVASQHINGVPSPHGQLWTPENNA